MPAHSGEQPRGGRRTGREGRSANVQEFAAPPRRFPVTMSEPPTRNRLNIIGRHASTSKKKTASRGQVSIAVRCQENQSYPTLTHMYSYKQHKQETIERNHAAPVIPNQISFRHAKGAGGGLEVPSKMTHQPAWPASMWPYACGYACLGECGVR